MGIVDKILGLAGNSSDASKVEEKQHESRDENLPLESGENEEQASEEVHVLDLEDASHPHVDDEDSDEEDNDEENSEDEENSYGDESEAGSNEPRESKKSLTSQKNNQRSEQEDDEDFDNSSQNQRGERRPNIRTNFNSAADLMKEGVAIRLKWASPQLFEQLNGSVLVKITNADPHYPNNTYLVNAGDAKDPIKAGVAQDFASLNPDCTLTISEQNLLKISAGDLNPQLAILTDKMKVDGKSGLAVYFFNLIAPR